MRLLSRYLLRQHIAPLAFALAALTGLMLLNQVAKQFGSLVGKGLPWGVILEVFVLSLPFVIAMTLPMAVLVAVLYAFGHLAADNEITAMKAGGISVERLLRPVLAGAAVVSLVALAWSDQLLPRSNHRLRTLLVDIQRKKPSFTLREQVINDVVRDQFYLRASRIDPATNELRDVTIYDLADPVRRRIISADSGRMAFTPSGEDLYLTLRDGTIKEVEPGDPTQFNRTFFVVNHIRVPGVGNTLERTEFDTFRGDREMTICDMEVVIADARRDAAERRRTARRVVAGDLRRLVGLAPVAAPRAQAAGPRPGPYCRLLGALGGLVAAPPPESVRARSTLPPSAGYTVPPAAEDDVADDAQGAAPPARPPGTPLVTAGAGLAERQHERSARHRAAMYQVEVHKKFAISAACLVFALVGVPLALRFPRGGVGLVIGTSLVVFTIYYVGLIGGEELGDRLIVSPFAAMWTPNVLLTALGLLGLWLVRREGASTRGGDWAELRDALLLRRWRRA